ncbi:EGF-like domain protein [Ancylostoma ceylanicum]|uniref:EGF-like domain protein n=1 Tax=Ancylostoma ceylanicum TaxID=53326 RepID=A0A0D6M6E0_9BILA|nr:EGF-like domain protein [Ancylostoma ceylanicum]
MCCLVNYAGILLVIAVSLNAKFIPGPCHQFSCENGGTCYPGVNSTHWCRCPPSYKGDTCEKPACGKKCQNDGVCVLSHENGTYSCRCQLGWDLWSSMRASPNRLVSLSAVNQRTCHTNVTIKIVPVACRRTAAARSRSHQ